MWQYRAQRHEIFLNKENANDFIRRKYREGWSL